MTRNTSIRRGPLGKSSDTLEVRVRAQNVMVRALIAILLAASLSPVARAETPLSYAASGHVTAPTLVDGRGPFAFVFDTGAEGSAVYATFAREHGLSPLPARHERLQGQTGAASFPLTRLASLGVDGRQAGDIEAVILPDRADGVALAGIVGLDLMGRFVVALDPSRHRLALHPPDTSARRVGGRGLAATKAMRLGGGLLGLPVTINGATGVAVLDTGARDSRINLRFAGAAGLGAGLADLPDDGVIQGATNMAVATKRARLGTVEFAGVRRSNVDTRVVDLAVFEALGLADRPAMILGMDLLSDLRLVIDFPKGVVWIGQGGGGESARAPSAKVR